MTLRPGARRLSTAVLGVLAALALIVVPGGPASAGQDDYPWRGQGVCSSTGQPTGYCSSSTWVINGSMYDNVGFAYRNCTSWVAWRMRATNGVADFSNTMRGGRWGNANTWDDNARALGYPVNSTPAAGAIAQTDAGTWGHVGWVRSANSDGSVTVEEYNRGLDGAFGVRTVPAPTFKYIHVKDLQPPRGKADLVAWEADSAFRVGLSTGTSFSWKSTPWLSGVAKPTAFAVGDVTGDGKSDIVSWEPYNNGQVMVGRSTGGSFSWSRWLQGTQQPGRMGVGDFNGS